MVSAPMDPELAEAHRRFDEEEARFRAALPELLTNEKLRGRWVLFKDGAVVASFDEAAPARDEGLRRFGKLGGFVVAPIEPERVHRIGGGFKLPDAENG